MEGVHFTSHAAANGELLFWWSLGGYSGTHRQVQLSAVCVSSLEGDHLVFVGIVRGWH